MFGTRSPNAVLDSRLSVLLGHLPGIRDGNEEAIHDARVATRRIREGFEIAMAGLARADVADIAERLQKAGRALGDARDPDALRSLLLQVETRFPLAASFTAHLRASMEQQRQRSRRRLIKQLESVNLSAIPKRLERLRAPRTWKDDLRRHVGARSSAVRAAVHHAGGVYFPKRSHSARVAIKKLRYALELAEATGLWRPRAAIRRLKRAQEALGDAHDRQVLIERIDALGDPSPGTSHSRQDAVVQFLEAEIAGLHRKYADMRADIEAICDACARFAKPRHTGRVLLAAGVVLPSLVMLGRRAASLATSGDASSPQPEDVRVRIPVA